MPKLLCTITLSILFVLPARADLGWIPDYQKLYLKTGFDYFRTSENFLTDGRRSDFLFRNNRAQLTEVRLWVEPEYGIAPDWSVLLRFGFTMSTLAAQANNVSLLDANGVGDLWAGVKYSIRDQYPILTAEVAGKIPTYSMNASSSDQLLLGDGNFDLLLQLHLGHRIGHLVLALSPGILARFQGYASAAQVDAAIQFQFERVYIRGVGNFLYSFGDYLLFDSGANIHDAPGAGGSYALLSGSPAGASLGAKAGVVLVPDLQLEAGFTQAVAGSRYPNFLQFTADLFLTFDFFEPDQRQKLREVPLGEKPRPFYQQ